MCLMLEFWDTLEYEKPLLILSLFNNHKHLIDTSKQVIKSLVNTALAISKKFQLKLFNPPDLQGSMLGHKLQPIIFETGASLAIT